MYKLHFSKVGKPAGNVHGHQGQLLGSNIFGLKIDKSYHNWTNKQAMYTLTYELQTQTTVIYHYREQSLNR